MELCRGEISLLSKFLSRVKNDERITVWHISIYAALAYCWEVDGCRSPISISRREIMQLSHIWSLPTYHKYMRELVQLEFIKYLPSYNPYLGSLVWLNIPAQ
jgi:hypothetical protein